MRVELSSLSPDNFMVHQHFVGEHMVMLVQPQHIGAVWQKETMIFRSSVWDSFGNPVSLSFKKFHNWDEKPDLFPPPANLDGAVLMEKMDGSTLIFSRYKGHTVIRTRGTVDARKQENGHEIDFLMEKYPKFIAFLEKMHDSPHSYIYEWLSPSNKIVLDYGPEPDMVLTAMISHADYSMRTQDFLDLLAQDLGLRRPRTFSYNSVSEMKDAVEMLRDQEGLCVYYNDGQNIRKVKSAHYLFLHRAKSEISSIEKVMDVYVDWYISVGEADTSYNAFFDYLTKKFDFEIATMARGHASNLVDAMKEVRLIIEAMKKIVASCKGYNRKQAAYTIMQSHGNSGRSAIMFRMLDNKPFVADDYKKLLFQVLK